MKRWIHLLSAAVLVSIIAVEAKANDSDFLAYWSFDGAEISRDTAGNIEDLIEGSYKQVKGVKGNAIKMDGYTTCIIRKAEDVPETGEGFTFEAWIALGAYPWNWCSVVSQNKDKKDGFYFAVGPRGELTLQLAVNDKWHKCTSDRSKIELRKWHHVAGTFNEETGIIVYVDGEECDYTDVKGKMNYARETELLIGANHEKDKPSNIHREHGTLPWWYCLDGIVDELKIHGRALSGKEIQTVYEKYKPGTPPDLQQRLMPSGPKGPGRFGAYYCHLKYYDEWDNLWEVDADPDVLVRFDKSGVRMVFWRGSRYSAAWVSENGLWMADQSVEAWGVGENDKEGCFEHMQDRRCRYSHVRVIESNHARAVVHWRYAPVSSYDHLWRVDEKTGRACWIDEYYYVYPDQTAIRKVSWKTGTLGHPRQFQESLPFTQPGQFEGDVVNRDFATVANLKGQTLKMSYSRDPKKKENIPEDLLIQQYNFRSKNKPFIIFEPGNRMHYIMDVGMGPRGLDIPGACNHWPVGQMPCDGRTSQAADRPTHFLGFPISDPPIHEKDGRSWWNGLYGMNEMSIKELITIAKSWVNSPEFKLKSKGFENLGYDRSERAYKLKCTNGHALEFELAGSENSVIYNPAFVIDDWKEGQFKVKIDGEMIEQGKDLRIGYRHTLEGTKVIIWLKKHATKPVKISIS